jgi:hypothetical protein
VWAAKDCNGIGKQLVHVDDDPVALRMLTDRRDKLSVVTLTVATWTAGSLGPDPPSDFALRRG